MSEGRLRLSSWKLGSVERSQGGERVAALDVTPALGLATVPRFFIASPLNAILPNAGHAPISVPGGVPSSNCQSTLSFPPPQ